MQQPSESLMDLIFEALDHGINSVRSGGPLIPFLITDGEAKKLHRFVTDTLEEGLKKAQEMASSLDAAVSAYAIAYDGFVTIEGKKYDAIMVEAAERSNSTGFLVAQRYKPRKGLFSRFEVIGNSAFLEELKTRFK